MRNANFPKFCIAALSFEAAIQLPPILDARGGRDFPLLRSGQSRSTTLN